MEGYTTLLQYCCCAAVCCCHCYRGYGTTIVGCSEG